METHPVSSLVETILLDGLGRFGFVRPWLLWLAVPWLVGMAIWGRGQLAAVRFVDRNVDARFRPRLTLHRPNSLVRYLAWLTVLGLLSLAAAAGPSLAGGTQITAESGHVLLLLDGSASMKANDVEGHGDRFEQARALATELVDALPDSRFAMATFSGEASLQLPPRTEPRLVHEALRVAEVHNYYTGSGSNLTAALDAALAVAESLDSTPVEGRGPGGVGLSNRRAEGKVDLQVVLFSDGEIPTLEDGTRPPDSDYSNALAAVVARGLAVHAIALGSEAGQARLIHDFRDVVAKKPREERRVLRRFHTRRDDRHLRRMAEATGGRFAIASSSDAVEELAAAIRQRPDQAGWLGRQRDRRDLSHWPLGLFLLLFAIDGLDLGRKRAIRRAARVSDSDPPGPPERFRLDRLGPSLLLLLVLVVHGCDAPTDPLQRAHRENERGIGLDSLGQSTAARRHFERSRSFGEKAHVPVHNLARSLADDGRFAEAHETFQAALALRPELAEAHFNDGVTLYLWGVEERDPHECQLERTRELWQRARDRFASTLDFAEPDSDLARQADANYRATGDRLADLERRIAAPPESCRAPSTSARSESPSPEPAGGRSDDDGGSAGGGSAGGSSAGGGSGRDAEAGESGQADAGQADSEPTDRRDGRNARPRPREGAAGQGEPARSAAESPVHSASSSASSSAGALAPSERRQIEAALERIATQRREAGKYHRRTRGEQFSRASWQNPERVIWW